ncbi:unnamed protein product, partial [marine sediment metagenome]
QIYTGSRAGAMLAVCGLVAFAGLGQPWFKLRERFLLGVSVVMTICAYVFSSDAPALVFSALQRAAFLAAFMILLALLRDAAVTSPSVLAVGTFLTKQRPGKRYAALHIGGHALGVVLNFGALSLLGPLVQRGVRGDGAQDKTVTEIRERRQLSALDRGFSWIIAWSPTAVANAMVPVIVVGAQPGRMAMMGGVAAVAMFFVGWLEDKLRFRSLRASLAAKGVHVGIETPKFPKAPFWWFVSICLVLVGLAIAFMVSFQVSMVAALMLAAPLVTALWIWLQNRTRKDAWSASLARYRDIAMNSIPNGSPEALTLSSAGYTGLVAGGLLQAGSFADTLGLNDVPPLMIYIGVAALIPLASNAAMPPMMVVTFLAAMMTSSAMPGLDMTMLGFSFVMGWALNLTGSPFGASSLILSRVTGIPGTTLSWRWNGVFTLVAFLVVSVLVVVFSP